MNNNSANSSRSQDRQPHAFMLRASHLTIASILSIAACLAALQSYRKGSSQAPRTLTEIVRH